ncbi:MAG: hypothetical protein RL885_12030 [Planctomycetota bacterium]
MDEPTLGARIQTLRPKVASARRRESRAGAVAVALLFLGVLLTIVSAQGFLPLPWWAWSFGSLIAIVATARLRARLTRRRLTAEIALQWLERSLSRLQDRFDFGQDDGEGYLEETHPFARDLDLFGPGSLYHRINTTHTVLGRDALAETLSSTGPDARERQALVQELAVDSAFREDAEVAWCLLEKRNPKDRRDLERLERTTRSLLESPAPWLNEGPGPVAKTLAWIGTLTGTAAALGAFFELWPLAVLAAVWAIQLFILIGFAAPVSRRLVFFETLRTTLDAWTEVLTRIEAWQPQSALGQRLVAPLHEGTPASLAVRRLKVLADRLSWRRNAFFAFSFGVLWMWDLHAWSGLANWWRRNGERVGPIFRSAARIEAELALATYAAAVPGDADASFTSDTWLAAEGLEHPLLPRAERVANDLSLERAGRVDLVTGSNMSGKSTFLRAAGLAVVMARLGLPVAARSFGLHPDLGVVTCMRVEDSLRRGASRFFAEATRLATCLEATNHAPATLCLLDEILAGTNSKERHEATEALLDALTQRPAITLVATHDLELAELAGQHPDQVRVFHFRDQADGDTMVFDYQRREGVLPATNALRVLRALGLPIPNE